MGKFSYYVSRDKSCGNIYEIFTEGDNTRLIVENNDQRDSNLYSVIFKNPVIGEYINRDETYVDELLTYLETCDAENVLAGKDKNAHLTACLIHDDLSISFDVNGQIEFKIERPNSICELLNFTVIRQDNNQDVELTGIYLSDSGVCIDELRSREPSSVKRSLIFNEYDYTRIDIIEYS